MYELNREIIEYKLPNGKILFIESIDYCDTIKKDDIKLANEKYEKNMIEMMRNLKSSINVKK